VIKTNLSTRPFYNEHAVHLWLLVITLAVIAATAFNVSRVIRYSRSDTRLATQASRDEARAADLRRQAAQLRASVDPKQVDFASADARQANDLIDRRTFSWTELLNHFETTLPSDVRITSVKPRLDRDRGIVLEISIVARGVDDVKAFMLNLEHTGVFANVRPASDRINEQGLLESVLDTSYAPQSKPASAGPATAAPAPALAPASEVPR
jgi:Tfp pilus assembly protein PilN